MYITQALVKGSPTRGIFEIEFKTKEGIVKTYQLKSALKTLPRLIQVKVFCTGFANYTTAYLTFFDFPSRCKKCGRFYKVYCKSCHQKSEWTNMIMDRFAEEIEIKEDFSDLYKAKEEERNDCDPAPADPQEK
jgi:hypothetical protein